MDNRIDQEIARSLESHEQNIKFIRQAALQGITYICRQCEPSDLPEKQSERCRIFWCAKCQAKTWHWPKEAQANHYVRQINRTLRGISVFMIAMPIVWLAMIVKSMYFGHWPSWHFWTSFVTAGCILPLRRELLEVREEWLRRCKNETAN